MNPLAQLSVEELKGVGTESRMLLESIGIHTIDDLLNYFPYRYEDYRVKDIVEAAHDERITIEGTIQSAPNLSYFGRKKSRLTFKLLTGRHLITVIFFNQPYIKNKLTLNAAITVTGKWDKNRLTLTASEYKLNTAARTHEFEPVYHTRGDLSVKMLRKWIKQAYADYYAEIPEILPERYLTQYKLPPRNIAMRYLHFPKDGVEVKHAHRRFVYEEFLLFQLKMQALRKFNRESSNGKTHAFNNEQVKSFISSLPFELTDAQKKVVNEILADMKSPYRMNRLLQGDVGSGKTVVAAILLYAAVTAGSQGALMVPTEILPEQHANSLVDLLTPFGVEVALLTSSVKGKRRKEMIELLACGEIDILIGTHALIQKDVNFKELGLVITDEQHRFGVNQRRILRDKGESPDVLFMTATPIPRTLAITAFGEMDVSIIDQLPSGRKAIETYWAKHSMLGRILQFMEKELAKGRQAYVICPLIEESEKLDLQNVLDVHSAMNQYFTPNYTVGLMHGKLPADEKDEVMRGFGKNEIQILVSTTVVEVGVNVPNASVMVIYDAERFGLSQLHQLRGRVGRGAEQSYCGFIAAPKTEVGVERLNAMCETSDGFVLSEKDLELRGPGDFFGSKQSGLPEFKMADMVHDYRALETARKDADELVNSDEFWESDEFAHLRDYLNASGILEGEKLD